MNSEYKKPKLLQQLMEWERSFAHEVEYLEEPSGLFLGLDYSQDGYFCTPVDSIPFARTGGDGIHFALLTDFGGVKDLEEAVVIRVSPMDTERVRIIANNINDFFALHFYNESLAWNEFQSEDQYLDHLKEEQTMDRNSEWFDYDRWKFEKGKVLNEVKNKFNILPIEQPFSYIKNLRFERSFQVSVNTLDSIGIKQFMPRASNETIELLALVRHLQYTFSGDKELIDEIAKDLRILGYHHETDSLISRLLI
ncbi:hypothetical protein [Paenibacillus sp. FSL K6-2862]|uniref:hypothetical protein n=1 Tax=Paenibacillus sp. FSL K6-2862 TaxID=2921484 RepID=UPI0030FCB9D1